MNKAFMYQKLVAFLGFLVYKLYGEELPETLGSVEHLYGSKDQ